MFTLDVCIPNPCQNNGKCTYYKDQVLGIAPACSCVDGWYGYNCTESKSNFTHGLMA